jgi:hypothetical protein
VAIFVAAALVAGVGLSGCRETGPAGNTVSGKFTYKSLPVANGNFKFFTKTDKGFKEIYSGVLKQDGSFSFSGIAAFGDVVVTVTAAFDPLAEMAQKFKNQKELDDGLKKMKEAITQNKGDASQPSATSVPDKYKDPATSGLNWQIKEGSNSRDFDLQ